MWKQQAIDTAKDKHFQTGKTQVVYFDLEEKEFFVEELGIDCQFPVKFIGEY